MDDIVTIFVNGNPKHFPVGVTLEEVLQKCAWHDKNGIAVAVNQRVIPRHQWANVSLQANDEILIVQAVPGG